MLRRDQREQFEKQLPALATLVTLTDPMVAVFSSTASYLEFRRGLSWQRRLMPDELSWSLHVLAAVKRLPAQNDRQLEADRVEVSDLALEVDLLRAQLFPDRVRPWSGALSPPA